jgi:hypothetical protein
MRYFLIALALLGAWSTASAAEPHITDLHGVAKNGRVSVSFRLAHGFDDPQFMQALQSGIPTGFTFHVEIIRSRPYWFDEEVGTRKIETVATYNSVTREYLVNYRREGLLVRSETLTSLSDLQARMTSVDERDLFRIGSRPPYKFVVRVKADLARTYQLYFIPFDLSTRWHESRVTEQP